MRKALDLLNMHRLQSGVDVYGQGRKPWIQSTGCVVVLTDAGMFCSAEGPQTSLDLSPLPYLNVVAQAITPEPYRFVFFVVCFVQSDGLL